MHDHHCHVFDPRSLGDFFWRRWRVPADVLRVIGHLRDAAALAQPLMPDAVDRAMRAAGVVLDRALGGWYDLLQAVYAPPIQQVRRIVRNWDDAGVLNGTILIPALGDYRDLTARVLQAVDVLGVRRRVDVYAPVGAQMPGVDGIKLYPSLEPDAAIANALASGMPIVAHCSPGGVRAPGVTAAQARRRNGVQWLVDALQAGWRGTVTLAHAGGDWRPDGPVDRLLRDTCPGASEYPGVHVYVDTALVMYTGASKLRVCRLQPWWSGRVMHGSDYPLHLPLYDYRHWARQERWVWGC